MIRYSLTLDQGTTNRAIAFDDQDQIRARARREFQQISPQSGWVEHGAGGTWHTLRIPVSAA